MKNKILEIIGIIISILTLGLGFYIFYELFFEYEYFKNRYNLYKLFKNNKVDIGYISYTFHDKGIIEYRLSTNYYIYYYKEYNRLEYFDSNDNKLINLSIVSPISLYYNNEIINYLNQIKQKILKEL